MAARKGKSEPVKLTTHEGIQNSRLERRSTFPMTAISPVQEQNMFSLKWKVDQKGHRRRPNDVCFLEDGSLAVAEKNKSRIRLYDSQGQENLCIDRDKDPGLLQPSTLVAYESNLLLAADLNQIHYFTREGQCVNFWQPASASASKNAEYNCLTGVCLSRIQEFIVSDISAKPSVGIFSPKTGKLIRNLKLPKGETFKRPNYIASHPVYGQIYVSDCDNNCIYTFDGNGRYVCKIGQTGKAEENLVYPLGVDIGTMEDLIVADYVNDSVSAYSMSGQFKYHLLTADDGLQKPVGISYNDKDCTLAVTEEHLGHKSDTYSVKLFQTLQTDRRVSKVLSDSQRSW